jgi:hypothetical protein
MLRFFSKKWLCYDETDVFAGSQLYRRRKNADIFCDEMNFWGFQPGSSSDKYGIWKIKRI